MTGRWVIVQTPPGLRPAAVLPASLGPYSQPFCWGGGGSYSAHVGGHFTKAAPSSIYPGTFLRTGSAQEVMRQTGAGKEKTFWAGGRGVGGGMTQAISW